MALRKFLLGHLKNIKTKFLKLSTYLLIKHRYSFRKIIMPIFKVPSTCNNITKTDKNLLKKIIVWLFSPFKINHIWPFTLWRWDTREEEILSSIIIQRRPQKFPQDSKIRLASLIVHCISVSLCDLSWQWFFKRFLSDFYLDIVAGM